MSVKLVKEDLAQDKGVPGSRRPTTTKPTTPSTVERVLKMGFVCQKSGPSRRSYGSFRRYLNGSITIRLIEALPSFKPN